MKTHHDTAIRKASLDTSRFMSAHVRAEAHNSGWPQHITSGLHVRYSNGEFNVHGHKSHITDIKNLEYGTPTTQPTAALRRFANRTSEAESFFLNRLAQHLGERYI